MIQVCNFSEEFFRKTSRRLENFFKRVGNRTAQETVLFSRDVIEALSHGELIRGSVFADERGRVYFFPHDIGNGAKLGTRKPKLLLPAEAEDKPTANTKLNITLRVILEQGQVTGVSLDTDATPDDNDVMRLMNQIFNPNMKGGMNANN